MKKTATLFLALFLLVGTVLLLSSCGKKSDVPEGMQLASYPDLDGFYFYVPEGYEVTRTGDVITALVSTLDPTSLSAYRIAPGEATVADYWAANRDGLSSLCDEGTEIAFEDEDISVPVGERDAHAYIYAFVHGGVNYKVTQIIVTETDVPSDGAVVLTYTGKTDKTVTGTVGYSDHYTELETVLQYFSFTDAKEDRPTPEPITEGAPEGMQLASRPKTVHYALYVPDDWKIDSMTGFSSACSEDGKVGASVVSHYPEGVSTVEEYFIQQKEKLGAAGYTVTCPEEQTAENLTVGGTSAFRYGGYLTKGGETLRFSVVYVLLRNGIHRGLYTITLTALAEDAPACDLLFDEHADEFDAILNAFTFRN